MTQLDWWTDRLIFITLAPHRRDSSRLHTHTPLHCVCSATKPYLPGRKRFCNQKMFAKVFIPSDLWPLHGWISLIDPEEGGGAAHGCSPVVWLSSVLSPLSHQRILVVTHVPFPSVFLCYMSPLSLSSPILVLLVKTADDWMMTQAEDDLLYRWRPDLCPHEQFQVVSPLSVNKLAAVLSWVGCEITVSPAMAVPTMQRCQQSQRADSKILHKKKWKRNRRKKKLILWWS